MNTQHPFEVGDMVCHMNQEWARAERIATAVIHEVKPQGDGSYEYVVRATQDFSRRPGPDNPIARETQWSDRATVMIDDGS